MADTMILPETQKLYEQQEELTELQAYANMLNTPDVDGKIGEVTDLTAVMRIKYNAGSSTRIHTSDAFNKYFAEFVKANAPELITRTVQKALEMIKEQKALAAQEVLDQLNITGYNTQTSAQEGAPVFTGSMQAVGYAGEPISHYINAASLPISVITFTSDDLPDGLVLDENSGLLTGTVDDAGTYGVTIKATNDKGTTTKVLSLIIAERTQPNIPAPTAPMIYGQLSVKAIQNKPFVFQCGASNLPASGAVWTIDPDLSVAIPGLYLDPATGKITGTPTTVTPKTPFVLKVEVPGGGWDSAQFDLEVVAEVVSGGPSINTINDRTIIAGHQFYATCTGQNLTPGAVWSLVSDPTGALSINASTGQITGTPTVIGAHTIKVKVQLIEGTSAEKEFTLTVEDALTITSSATITATAGSLLTHTVTCNKSGASLVAPVIPSWLNFDPSTGTLTGTPTVAGTETVVVIATLNGETVYQTITITIS